MLDGTTDSLFEHRSVNTFTQTHTPSTITPQLRSAYPDLQETQVQSAQHNGVSAPEVSHCKIRPLVVCCQCGGPPTGNSSDCGPMTGNSLSPQSPHYNLRVHLKAVKSDN